MASINKAMLLGHVGADPEIRYIGEGENRIKVAQLRLATSKRYRKASGEDAEDTQWHTVLAYRGTADIVEKYVRKGTQLFVEGEIRYRSYTDRTGSVKYMTDIMAVGIQLLGGRPDPAVQGARHLSEVHQAVRVPSVSVPAKGTESQQASLPDISSGIPDDDLPF